MRLVLASTSPRRREIVEALDPTPECVAPVGDESPPRPGELPEEYVLRLSLDKARSVAVGVGTATVLGADTVVAVDGEILGKPVDVDDATRMLRLLRGRTHSVFTGVAALDTETGQSAVAACESRVTIRPLSDAELVDYIAIENPMDKSGAYAVQDKSAGLAESVDGCYLNVVGLPLCEVMTMLDGFSARSQLRSGWRPPPECVDCVLSQRLEAQTP
ncbi:MAG: Maf family protein [SAR202 cluster bacterium]|nr:Maf family protein [SAR202 cluster bacterium]